LKYVANAVVATAVLWFVIGLSAPLTPTFGRPSTREIELFAVLPVLVVAAAAQLYRASTARWYVRALSCAMAIFSALIISMERPL
jgi:hypothetical protein